MAQQVIQAIVKGRLLNSVETRNMFTYGCDTTTPGQTEADAIKNQVVSIYTPLLPYLNIAWLGYSVEVNYWDVNWWHPLDVYTVTLAGEGEEDFASFQSAILLTAKTQTKKAIGRKFFAGVDESFTMSGGLGISLLSAAASSLLLYLTPTDPILGKAWYPGIVSKNSPFAIFIGGTVGTILSTMRRRKPGYGI